MEILTKSFIESLEKGKVFSGIVFIKDYSKKVTKYGKDFIDGNLQFGITMGFKAWSDSIALKKLITEDYTGMACCITGTIDDFQGVKSVTLQDISAVEGYTEDMFLEVRYNKQAYLDAFNAELDRCLSDKGKQVRDLIFTQDTMNRFSEEFAAMKYHDNCKSGLLAHTYKMLCLLGWVVKSYPTLTMEYNEVDGKYVQSQDKVDLLYLGLTLHDVGKTIEMRYGVYQRNSFVGHTFFGTEMIVKHKDEIASIYGEDWYYQLVAILLQHHDEFETPCKTVLSYVVHNIDKLESTFTGLSQQMESATMLDSTGAKVKWDNKILAV